MLSGAALGIAGLQMQTLFRNPLADPFALGVSSGASLGVALVVLGSGYGAAAAFGSRSACGATFLVIAAAIAGSTIVLGLVLAVSTRIPNPTTVLILGLMFGYAVSAIVTVLVGASSPERLQQWRCGDSARSRGSRGSASACFAPLTLGGVLIGVHDVEAAQRAPARRELRPVDGSRRTARAARHDGGSLGAWRGRDGLLRTNHVLGVAVPHLCRGLLGTSDHRVLVPAVVLMGGTIALVAQIVSLLPGSAGILPLKRSCRSWEHQSSSPSFCAAGAEGSEDDAENAAALRTRDLAVGYRTRRVRRAVLERLNVTVHPGELVCLLGPNAAASDVLAGTSTADPVGPSRHTSRRGAPSRSTARAPPGGRGVCGSRRRGRESGARRHSAASSSEPSAPAAQKDGDDDWCSQERHDRVERQNARAAREERYDLRDERNGAAHQHDRGHEHAMVRRAEQTAAQMRNRHAQERDWSAEGRHDRAKHRGSHHRDEPRAPYGETHRRA